MPNLLDAVAAAIVMLAAASFPTAALAADDELAAVPYRPSVSTPAALSAPGWLEIEAGLQHDHDSSGLRRDSLPVTLKVAFTPDWGLRAGADAWVRQRSDGAARLSGVGDTAVVLKRRLAVDDANAFGLEAAIVAPTSRRGLGDHQAAYGINSIYSGDFGRWHTDVNVAGTRSGSGDVDAGTSRWQWLGAAAVSTALDERWGVVGELSGTNQRGADSTRQLLVAASYNVTRRLVLDAGAARSLRSGAPGWSAFAGFTWLAARLF